MVRLMTHPARRRGVTLVELLVALVLSVVVVMIGSLSVRVSLSTLSRVGRADTRASAITDALRTLDRHLASAEPTANDVRVVRDTALDVVHTIGMATVCRLRADTIVLGSSADSLPWRTSMPRGLTTDDEMRIGPTEAGVWLVRSVRDVSGASGTCGDSLVPWPGRAWQRIVLNDSVPAIRIGALVRVVQREKWSLVRGGDGQWSLSLATWDAGGARFGVPQPLVTPLASPSAPGGPGFVVAALDERGIPLADSALVAIRVVTALLRTARHARYGQYADSVRINVGAY